MKSESIPEKLALASIGILVFYLSYRYPLQINFSGTSPTYTDTPLYLQISKFIIALCSCFILLFFHVSGLNKSGLSLCFAVLLLESAQLFKGIILFEQQYIDSAFWVVAAFVFALHLNKISYEFIDKLIKIFLIISFTIDLIQFLLFIIYDRLPALAYYGTFSVRFGSFLDDPNGFAALCFLFLGWSFGFRDLLSRYIYLSATIIMILASQSMTAILLLIALSLAITTSTIFKKGEYTKKILISLVFLTFLIAFEYIIEFVSFFYEIKKASIEEHTQIGFTDLLEGNILEILIGGTDYKVYESWWLRSAFNMGIVWTSISILVSFLFVFFLYFKSSKTINNPEKRILCAFSVYFTYISIGNFNLPFNAVFPVSFIYYLILFWVSLKFGGEIYRIWCAKTI